MKKFLFIGVFLLVVSSISALYIPDSDTQGFGHFIRIQEVNITPKEIAPGEIGIISFKLINNGDGDVEDVIAKLILPTGLESFNDVDTVKISKIKSLESQEIKFRVIVLPGASEGIYRANLSLSYISYFAANFANVGDSQSDSFSLGIVVKSSPQIFVQIDDSNIYKGSENGDITIKFVNNGIADVKFLTIELEDTDDYDIVSNSKEYIGDLDSDDFESIDFRLNMHKKKGEISFPLKIDYKDSMNNDYEDVLTASMELRSAKELGVKKNNTMTYFWMIVVLGLIGWFGWKRYRKKIKKKHSS